MSPGLRTSSSNIDGRPDLLQAKWQLRSGAWLSRSGPGKSLWRIINHVPVMTPHEKVRCQASPNADVMDSQPVRRTEYGEPPGFEASGKQGAASVTLSPARRAISSALRCTMPRSRTAKLPLPCLHPNAGSLRGCGPSLPRAAGLARSSATALAPGRWPVSLWGSPIACAVVAARSWPSAYL